MAQATFVKSARKDYPEHGIKKGESYYWWAFMVGGRGGSKHYSKTPPKPSQLTQSEFWSAVFSLGESNDNIPSFDDIESSRDNIVDELNAILDETRSKLDNLPDSLQSGPSGELLQGRVDAVEDAISQIESVDCDIDEKEESESEEDFETRIETRAEEIWQEILDIIDNISCE